VRGFPSLRRHRTEHTRRRGAARRRAFFFPLRFATSRSLH